jgi:hypothetical protein
MKQKISQFLILTIFLMHLVVAPVFAQEKAVQKALETVKERLDDFIVAKDENDANALALRIEVFKKVIDLATSEAKELKIKLLSLDPTKDEAVSAWQDRMVANLDQALEYYRQYVVSFGQNNLPATVSQIKTMAEEFRKWRDENYLATAEQVNQFLLINQESRAIEIAEKRATKIAEDLVKLQKSAKPAFLKNFAGLNNSLAAARNLIEEAKGLNQQASELFREKYLLPYLPADEATLSTSTVDGASVASTTVEVQATEESSSIEPHSPSSIKDLVKDSLSKIRGAYQIFIEMSNLVRKLLG